jgi:hypothetical protein
MPQPSTLRLILNTADLTAANAARLKQTESNWLRCNDIPEAVKCVSVSRWACRKSRRKNSQCMRVLVLTMAGRKEMF